MDLRLELVLIPVSDVDRAKAFYTEKLGFSLDVDHQPSDEFRVVQMTPPGSYRGTHLVVSDIVAAREQLAARGVDIGEVRHFDRTALEWRPGPDPARGKYASFADFADPDGNTWVLQEVPESSGE